MNTETENAHRGEEQKPEKKNSGLGDVSAQVLSIRLGNVRDVKAESVDITQGAARHVEGSEVTLRQAGAQSVKAETLVIRQGGALQAEAERLEVLEGGVVLARAKSANLTASRVAVVLSGGDVKMDQAGARVVLARGDVTMDQAGSLVLAAPSIKAQNCGTFLLIAGRVDGEVRAAFGPRESVIFGAMTGAVAGLVLLLARLVRRARR
jgi:hypothetical protein